MQVEWECCQRRSCEGASAFVEEKKGPQALLAAGSKMASSGHAHLTAQPRPSPCPLTCGLHAHSCWTEQYGLCAGPIVALMCTWAAWRGARNKWQRSGAASCLLCSLLNPLGASASHSIVSKQGQKKNKHGAETFYFPYRACQLTLSGVRKPHWVHQQKMSWGGESVWGRRCRDLISSLSLRRAELWHRDSRSEFASAVLQGKTGWEGQILVGVRLQAVWLLCGCPFANATAPAPTPGCCIVHGDFMMGLGLWRRMEGRRRQPRPLLGA